MRQTSFEPAELTPQERRQEVAALLARGVLRLRQCRCAMPSAAEADAEEISESLPG
jgi:hypothetical protein